MYIHANHAQDYLRSFIIKLLCWSLLQINHTWWIEKFKNDFLEEYIFAATKGTFSTLRAVARTGYLPHLHSFTVVADLTLVQNDWQKADIICGKFKQEHTVSSVNCIDLKFDWIICDLVRDLIAPMQLGLNRRCLFATYRFMAALLLY